ncbi:MAG: efflux RND transporter permease subunit [Verrucomicrobiales bacterium]
MIAWFAKNGVAANLLMFAVIVLGIFSATTQIPLEVFPEVEVDEISVSVTYRGATPSDVEELIVERLEQAVADLEGIEEMRSEAFEGRGRLSLEVERGADPREVLDDVKNRVDAINTLPPESERPIIALEQRPSNVISVIITGQVSERELRRVADRVYDDLTALPELTVAAVKGVRPFEIAIEIPEASLRAHGLTLDEVAAAIRAHSVNVPVGLIRAEGGEILLRTQQQAYSGDEFAGIPLLAGADGSRLTVGDIAEISDAFEEEPVALLYNGKPAAIVQIFRMGEQNAIDIAEAVQRYIAENQPKMPPGIELSTYRDSTKVVRARLATLVKSAWQGGIFVFIILTLFLRPSLAAWVCAGIPVAFCGALALMPAIGVTINIVSLFAFILVLGIVVDDAIVTGEAIFVRLRKGEDPLGAAINGAESVAVPVTFGVLTTVIAFAPIFFMEGRWGKIFFGIPAIIIPVLLFSLIESKLILPSHLKHLRAGRADRDKLGPLARFQRKFSDGMETFVEKIYAPFLRGLLRWRYVTAAAFAGLLILFLGLMLGGQLRFVQMPSVYRDSAAATLTMPPGTPFSVTDAHLDRIAETAEALKQKFVDHESGQSVIENVVVTKGTQDVTRGDTGSLSRGSTNQGSVMVEITPSEFRASDIEVPDITKEWRKLIGPIPGAKELSFFSQIGRRGSPIDIQINGDDFGEMHAASARLQEQLRQFSGVTDVRDTFEDSKGEIKVRLNARGEQLGLTPGALGRQVRAAFFGVEAQRIQRGRDDIRVMVRYPGDERARLASLRDMKVLTPAGAEVPLGEVAALDQGSSPTSIRRIDRKRNLNVLADFADDKAVDQQALLRDLQTFIDTQLAPDFPHLRFQFEGDAGEQRDSNKTLKYGGMMLAFALYVLLAIPFRSYLQPLIVMSVIPFGLIGAVSGHLFMEHILGRDMPLSMMSLFGMLALSGVVVNDSLVLVDFINSRRRDGIPLAEAIRQGGARRFRAIILTSLTTFGGLIPLILERSTQAQFLIPMAVSLGFGIIFATAITLILVPVCYYILEDIVAWLLPPRAKDAEPEANAAEPEPEANAAS